MKWNIFKSNNVLASVVNTQEEAIEACDRNPGWTYNKVGSKGVEKWTKEEKSLEVLRKCINKELELYEYTYSVVLDKENEKYWYNMKLVKVPVFLGLFVKKKLVKQYLPWYQYFTFNSQEEYNSWKEYCIDLFKKELKMSDKAAKLEFAMLDLNYGLKQSY